MTPDNNRLQVNHFSECHPDIKMRQGQKRQIKPLLENLEKNHLFIVHQISKKTNIHACSGLFLGGIYIQMAKLVCLKFINVS